MKCVDCLCVPELCNKVKYEDCKICIKDNCCFIEIHLKEKQTTVRFFFNVKNLYASALGIEILCILSAELGQNGSFFLFGYKTPFGIVMSYVLGYGLAGFTTFATILGRYNLEKVTDGCCSILEHQSNGFMSNLKSTFKNFESGITRIPLIYKQDNFRQIVKTSLYVLVASESVCIITAETVNLVFFRHALWLSIPLSLFAGALAITLLEAYKRTKSS